MKVVSTSENGVVDHNTIFHFRQKQDMIYAQYSGGQIAQGYLVGNLIGTSISFTYCQRQVDGVLDYGASKAILSYENGRLRITEKFEWASRPGKSGINILEEVS